MRIPKFFSSNFKHHKNPTIKIHSSHLSSRPKSSNKRSHPRKSSGSKKPNPKNPSPSFFQRITELVGSEDPAFSFSNEARVNNPSTPTVCRIARESSSLPNSNQLEKAHVDSSSLVDVSPIVHRITEVLRSDNTQIPIEQRLDEMDVELSAEIVEKVLKRCFKVGHLALTFFNWVKLQPGFSHITETYNTMIYIAGDSGDIDLVEKLAGEMDEESCLKNIKTWTILILYYGKAKKISKALSSFEEMRKSGCKLDSEAYEAIIRALINVGKSELAMEFYNEMKSRNIEVIDIKLYELLMNCLCRSGDIAGARGVGDDLIKSMKVSANEGYARILRSFCVSGKTDEAQALLEETKKENVVIDSKASEILLKGLCRASRMDEAMKVVDSIKQHSPLDSKIYSILIDGLLRDGDILKALTLLHDMREFKCVPLVSTYTQIIQCLFRSNEYDKACEIYEEMIENGIKPDVVATTAMIAGHIQHNCVSEAWEVFGSMNKKGINPTSKAYSVFIKELCKASKPDEALKLLNEMVASNLNPTDDICDFVVSSLTRIGEIEKANIVKEMSKSFKFSNSLQAKRVYQSIDDKPIQREHDVKNYSSNEDSLKPKEYKDEDLKVLCRILSSSTDWNSIEEFLEKSTIHFTSELVVAVLNSCQRHGHASLKFFSWLRKEIRHTTETYNLAIKISGSAKDFRRMRELYREMKRNRCSITANTWTIMISQYGQAGLTEIALNTFREMKHEGFQPNASTFKYLIVFLCGKKGRKLEEAQKIFEEMVHEGFMPDRETTDIYLSSLCESGKLIDARRCIKSLIKKGFTKQLGYSLLVKGLCRAGEVEEALLDVKAMENDGCTIDQFIYGSIVHALLRKGKLNEAFDQVEEMRRAGINQSVHIQTSFIVHFCREEQIEKALEIFNKITEDGIEPTLVTYSAMIRGYMNMGMVSDAWDVFGKLKLKGLLPDFETYSMFISCLCKAGKSEDGLKLIHEMLNRGIIPSAVNFRTVFHGLNREGKQYLAHSVLQTKWNLKRQRMVSY
ncbi:putative pentatricopeptide repeat-containing protein At5g06400, mitochondrial [Asparagus officinalis]|uniref:putative pentatricopeptide repeat-containing protein At5g06400, mitochondrial n=1 Tax=Asparagus officinalis TaxID=4686 RepID=UPI00098E35D7|nr:putative pentatricopeptide repeat-containing protein At5g06400, mitochondrial [Asparagus officinalis]